MVKYYNGEMYTIPKEFEEEVRADERTKCKCPYWNEEHRECATSFEEDIRADERKKVLDELRLLMKERADDCSDIPNMFDKGYYKAYEHMCEEIAQLKK